MHFIYYFILFLIYLFYFAKKVFTLWHFPEDLEMLKSSHQTFKHRNRLWELAQNIMKIMSQCKKSHFPPKNTCIHFPSRYYKAIHIESSRYLRGHKHSGDARWAAFDEFITRPFIHPNRFRRDCSARGRGTCLPNVKSRCRRIPAAFPAVSAGAEGRNTAVIVCPTHSPLGVSAGPANM